MLFTLHAGVLVHRHAPSLDVGGLARTFELQVVGARRIAQAAVVVVAPRTAPPAHRTVRVNAVGALRYE